MAIRITGMNSGLDTDSIVQELVSAYRAKGDKYVKQQTKLSWTQDVWKSLNTKIFNFYKSLDSFRLSSNVVKKATVSDASKATVTVSNNAVNGTQTLEVLKTAEGGYMTGGKLNGLSDNPTLLELGYSKGVAQIKIEGKDGSKTIQMSSSTTVEEFTKQINESGTGVKAEYKNGKISLSSENGKISISGANSNGSEALSRLGISGSSGSNGTGAYMFATDSLSITDGSNIGSNVTKDTHLSELGYTATDGKMQFKVTKDGQESTVEIDVSKDDTIEELQKKIDESGAGVKLIFNEGTQRVHFLSNEKGENVEFDVTATGSQDVLDTLKFTGAQMVQGTNATDGKITGTELKSGAALLADGKLTSNSTLSALGYNTSSGWITVKGVNGSKNIQVSADTTISDFVKQINESGTGVKASFDSENQRIYLSSEKTGKDGDFQLIGDGAGGTAALNMLKLTTDSGATKIDASDAVIKLNGVEYTSSTNTVKVNGLTIQAQAVTNGKVTITTDTDTQGMYDKIKDLITDYNSLINEMYSLYNADSSKGYEPLTADEKEAMSDSEIAEWEKKIKDSLLRRDDTLSSIMTAMTSAMSMTVKINGKSYSLASLGIKTEGYFTSAKNEKYALHIDGDKDDISTSANTDKLMDMLSSDPEVVADIMKQITSKLYSNLDAKMKSTTLRSAYTVYNDKEMAKSYSDYTTTIKNWNKKVEDIEESYYKKFSAMETALAKLQSQMSSFTSMLGQ